MQAQKIASSKCQSTLITQYYGHQEYKNRCSLLSHSIQTGLIAKNKGYEDELVLARFLHDIGRLLWFKIPVKQLKKMKCFEDKSYYKLGESYLRRKGISERVIAPIANYIQSKLYLSFSDSNFYEQLTPKTKKYLQNQGGIMTEIDAENFEKTPFFKESILLLQIEQKAKAKDFIILEHHFNLIENLVDSLSYWKK